MIRYLFTLLLFIAGTSHAAIQWQTDYEQAVQQSKDFSKPMILFFTGSDWCGWCTKLEKESLDTAEFKRDAGENFVFVKLDFPRRSAIAPQLRQQNEKLKEQFQIKSFPTLIVLDSNGDAIGLTGYRPGGGQQYASHLKKMVNDYTAYQQKRQK